ncbi:response regulator [Rhodopseudomonas palustris]|uniref:Response regulator n=1 Tax=Rhodopseudomonas palustris TaxID=1076 RepID=A0A323UMH9_RHOPL|nr:response regulator [Rhodopseudomonas palustris]PZA13477.1 response regulator [Rhodopseudomonas palustris]
MDASSEKRPRILIADDDPAVVKVLSSRCEKMGFAVDTACNGMQMLLKARRTAPDLMIVDVNMPKLDGLTASFHLLDQGGPALDILIVTGSSDETTIERCESMGLFYARKGPEFWADLKAALIEIFPHRAVAITAHSDAVADHPELVPNRPRVLIVDDDEQVGTFLASRLNKLGVETVYAPDAARALRLAVRRSPSVVVTDYYMPQGGAEFLITRLRSIPETANIPVLVLSERDFDKASAEALTREVLGHAGAVGIFKKSFDVSELFQMIQNFCAFEPSATMPS